jgi:hypothetical protein
MLPRGRFLLRPSQVAHHQGYAACRVSLQELCEKFEKSHSSTLLGMLCTGMTPHERCLQVLAAVVQFEDANGIILVEQAIDALIQAAGTDSVSKILALDELTEDLTVNGWNTDLAGVIREYIARQRELVIRDDRLD